MTDHENNNSISRNPFAALFSSVADARHFAEIQKQPPTPTQPAGERGGRAAGRGAGWRGTKAQPDGAPGSAALTASLEPCARGLHTRKGTFAHPLLPHPFPCFIFCTCKCSCGRGAIGAQVCCLLTSSASLVEETSASQDDSDNSVSESLDDCDYSVAEISRSFRSQQELCEQLNINHMIQRIFLITLDNSEFGGINGQNPGWVVLRWRGATRWQFLIQVPLLENNC